MHLLGDARRRKDTIADYPARLRWIIFGVVWTQRVKLGRGKYLDATPKSDNGLAGVRSLVYPGCA